MKKLLLIGLLIIGCDNNSTEPNAENYLFNLNLTDSTGEPINNTKFLIDLMN